jgi:glycogen debranching enzyme
MRYGFAKEAQRIVYGLLDAAEVFGWRLPELFCGFDRAEFAWPVPYPTSSSPQAWAAASPVQMVRTLLRLEPCIPYGRVWLDPVEMESLRISGLPLAGSRIMIEVDDQGVSVTGLPKGIKVINEPRSPMKPPPSQAR